MSFKSRLLERLMLVKFLVAESPHVVVVWKVGERRSAQVSYALHDRNSEIRYEISLGKINPPRVTEYFRFSTNRPTCLKIRRNDDPSIEQKRCAAQWRNVQPLIAVRSPKAWLPPSTYPLKKSNLGAQIDFAHWDRCVLCYAIGAAFRSRRESISGESPTSFPENISMAYSGFKSKSLLD
ncbi:hypothetical protein TNCV_371001 [Trichonephila clavipes]|nr:hypothetical protein TNCV_371001 [Trichonephila clavipes]